MMKNILVAVVSSLLLLVSVNINAQEYGDIEPPVEIKKLWKCTYILHGEVMEQSVHEEQIQCPDKTLQYGLPVNHLHASDDLHDSLDCTLYQNSEFVYL